MNVKALIRIMIAITIGSLILAFPINSTLGRSLYAPDGINLPGNPIAESPDYATLVLGDSWDISQQSDLSQYINESGQRYIIRDVRFDEGMLKGTSVGDINTGNNGYFFPLFPGYATAIQSGKVGSQYPIPSSTYSCLYAAMKVDSPAAGSHGPDMLQVHWFPDDWMRVGTFGYTNGIRLYPEAGNAQPNPIWKLYKVDLSNPPTGFGGQSWDSLSSWQGLRLAPTVYAGTPYQVDWLRLTDCNARPAQITFKPDSSIQSLWLRPKDTGRRILVATDVNGSSGSYNLDTQGLTPGEYYVGMGGNYSCCLQESQETLVINKTAVADFQSPSYTSGEDIATSFGNPWDFDDASDVTKIQNYASYSFQNGVMNLVTNPGPLPGGADARLQLNLPTSFSTKNYRYLTFTMKTEWENNWQNVPAGMIVRLIWGVLNSDGSTCYLVSQDIPFDIGWHTLSVDLHDGFAGSVEQTAGSCGGVAMNWKDITQPVVSLRFDTNENVTTTTWNPLSGGSPFYQQLDSITLTRTDSVTQGYVYPIRLKLNRDVRSIQSITYYYTTNLSQPKQNLASSANTAQAVAEERVAAAPAGSVIHLPLIVSSFDSTLDVFEWNTTSVKPGQYYICAEIDDGINRTTQCSEAPIVVEYP